MNHYDLQGAIIGAVLKDNGLAIQLIENTSPAMFEGSRLQVYEAISSLYRSREPINNTSIRIKSGAANQDVLEMVLSATDDFPGAVYRLKELAFLQLVDKAAEMGRKAYEKGERVETSFYASIREIASSGVNSSPGRSATLSDKIREGVARTRKNIEEKVMILGVPKK